MMRRRSKQTRIRAAAHRGYVQALAALYGTAPDLTPDQLLAMREQHRIEVDAKDRPQGELHLVPEAACR